MTGAQLVRATVMKLMLMTVLVMVHTSTARAVDFHCIAQQCGTTKTIHAKALESPGQGVKSGATSMKDNSSRATPIVGWSHRPG
jgi:hypothetical protein